MDEQVRDDGASNAGELVAQVNMADADEPWDAGDWPEPVPGNAVTGATSETAQPSRAPLLQALPLGLLALAVIALSMFVILSGVFEMIPN
jgi:hypothetical protein